tara:strand:- start:235 stop:1071 length:837 start_codon:yes stop_codon:yes gene_type:complete
MKELFDKLSYKCSEITTKKYSTSFSLGIKTLDDSLQQPIYNIYGFVRFADEIVDSFHKYDKSKLLDKFRTDTKEAIAEKISLNPILNSFQFTFHKYNIDMQLVDKFLDSMFMDLDSIKYDPEKYKKYIYGSAEVVGLMCLKVFVEGKNDLYESLKPHAMKLGSAFQKVNFLRDINSDLIDLGRVYFPNIDIKKFTTQDKILIEKEIITEFKDALEGIKKLPLKSRAGVYLAYLYYFKLFKKIRANSTKEIFNKRIRINNFYKIYLMFLATIKNKFNLL